MFFGNDNRKKIESALKKFLNNQADFLSERTINSPRSVGDAIQSIVAENFEKVLNGVGNFVEEYSSTFARRAMADLAFTDKDGFYYVVDVKTHRLDTKFNMPNLTSVERLSRFYEDDRNYFAILKIDYEIKVSKVEIKKVTFAPIEFFDWTCLTIGALGWGQIQIANANTVKLVPGNLRKKWMLELCAIMLNFYPREISKINLRLGYFKNLRKRWRKKQA